MKQMLALEILLNDNAAIVVGNAPKGANKLSSLNVPDGMHEFSSLNVKNWSYLHFIGINWLVPMDYCNVIWITFYGFYGCSIN